MLFHTHLTTTLQLIWAHTHTHTWFLNSAEHLGPWFGEVNAEFSEEYSNMETSWKWIIEWIEKVFFFVFYSIISAVWDRIVG